MACRLGTVDRRGQQDALFVTLVGRSKGIEANGPSFSPISTDLLRLLVELLLCLVPTALLYPLRIRAG